MSTKTASTVEGFRKPWTQGAYGYHEADTFEAAREGFKRVRSDKMFHMPNTGEAGKKSCVVCGNRLADLDANKSVTHTGAAPKPDKWSTWTYSASRKAVGNGMHYACSWSALFSQIFKLADEIA